VPNNAKPSSAPPRWAVTAGGTPATNISTPSSGQQDTGWTTGQVPPSAWQNWWQYWTYLWLLFLSYYFTSGGLAVGNTDLGATAESNVIPLSTFRDYGQNVRSVVDHNGYRMGQVSEIDENWRYATPTTLLLTPIGAPGGGGGGTSKFLQTDTNYAGDWILSANDTLYLPLSEIPVGAIISSITVYWKNAFGTQSLLATLYKGDPTSGGLTTSVVTKTVSLAATASSSFDIYASPTGGHGPKVVKTGETLAIQLAGGGSNTNPIGIHAVQVTYYDLPRGWSWTGISTEQSASLAWYNLDSVQFIDAYGAGQGWNNTLLNQRVVNIVTNGVSGVGDGETMLTSTYDTGFDADTDFVMEFAVATGTITDVANAAVFDLGLRWLTGTNRVYAHFDPGTNSGKWVLRMLHNAGITTVNTSVTVSANTVYRMRLELCGTNRNSAGHTQAKLYINGTLAATLTDSSDVLPLGDGIAALFRASTSTAGAGGAGAYNYMVGRVRRCWNHLASGDNL